MQKIPIFVGMKKFLSLLAALVFLIGCDADLRQDAPHSYRNVLLVCQDGFNNLSGSLESNVRTLLKNPLPMKNASDVLLVLKHSTQGNLTDYDTPTSPILMHLYSDWNGKSCSDTLRIYEKGTNVSDADFLRAELLRVRELFPSDHYGLLFSSHGTGWLPEEYFSKNAGSEQTISLNSVGCHAYTEFGKLHTKEIELPRFRQAVPFRLDYIVFDACLMGGVETAYELRDVADRIMFSPTEILSGGVDYKSLSACLLKSCPGDVVTFAENYYKAYLNSSASVSVVDCNRLGTLADVCRDLFGKYRDSIARLPKEGVQRLCNQSEKWFYDMRDILLKAGADQNEINSFDAALQECLLYEAHTPKFQSVKLNSCCGLSMFLPSTGTESLKEYYANLEWNKATGLVN